MGVSLPEHRSNEEILQEVKVEPIAMCMIRRRLECFWNVEVKQKTSEQLPQRIWRGAL